MSGYIEGVDREQSALFPERLEDWIDENNPVRVVDAFVDALDLAALGLARTPPGRMGRPKYRPSMLLKLYIYGYLNKVQSSRRLEREAGRNVEVMWLTARLAPDHKTIADFRKDNGKAIGKVCAQFVQLCRQIGLLTKARVAIDGSKFKAVNHRDNNFTAAKLKTRLAHLEASAARYLADLDRMDRQDRKEVELAKVEHLQDKLERIQQEVKRLEEIRRDLEASPDKQISLIDPDSRSMTSKGAGTGTVGYNVQSVVDTESHLIVTHEVTNIGSDRAQLTAMAQAAKDVFEVDTIDVVADRGYFSSKEILASHTAGITATIPKTNTSPNRKKGLYDKADFRYDAEEDVYRCPAGQKLTYRTTMKDDNGLMFRRYWFNRCLVCPLHALCTTGNERRVARWEHEHLLDDMQARLDKNPEAMRQRRSTVEHPFGTIKAWMGETHFQMKRLKNVSTEMALHVLAYNLTRVLNIIGVKALMRAIAA